jgi:hypothetical protein
MTGDVRKSASRRQGVGATEKEAVMMGDKTKPDKKDQATLVGDRPGTRTAADEHNREEVTHRDGRPDHGKMSKDPKGVFEERHKPGPRGERDFSDSPGRAAEASRKVDRPGQ